MNTFNEANTVERMIVEAISVARAVREASPKSNKG